MRAWIACALLVATSSAGYANSTEEVDREIAKRHYKQGSAYYAAGNYEGALNEFTQARKVMDLPALNFNIGRCSDRLEKIPQAIAAYQRYVDWKPTPDDAGEVTARIRVLRARIEEPAAVPISPTVETHSVPSVAVPIVVVPLVAVPAQAIEKPLVKRAWLWVVVAGAAAMVAVGITLGLTLGAPTMNPMATLGTVYGN